MLIHRLLQESHYSIFPDEIYNKPRSVKYFMYASLDLTLQERKKINDKINGKANN